jgi:hypothetical protein
MAILRLTVARGGRKSEAGAERRNSGCDVNRDAQWKDGMTRETCCSFFLFGTFPRSGRLGRLQDTFEYVTLLL